MWYGWISSKNKKNKIRFIYNVMEIKLEKLKNNKYNVMVWKNEKISKLKKIKKDIYNVVSSWKKKNKLEKML